VVQANVSLRTSTGRAAAAISVGSGGVGSADPRADAEVITIATDILQNLGLKICDSI